MRMTLIIFSSEVIMNKLSFRKKRKKKKKNRKKHRLLVQKLFTEFLQWLYGVVKKFKKK